MTFPKPPEKAVEWGYVDDGAFVDDGPADAWGLRELARNGNLAKARGGLVYRFLANAAVAEDGEAVNAQGAALGFGWPFWFELVPMNDFTVPKKPGLFRLLVAVRMKLTAGKVIEVQLASNRQPFTIDPAPGDVMVIEGTGSFAKYTHEFLVQTGGNEQLTFYAFGRTDPDTDALMDEAEYGANNSGEAYSVHWLAGSFTDPTSTWSDVAEGGHYVHLFSGSDARGVGPGVAAVLAQEGDDRLFFYPVPDSPLGLPIAGVQYELRELSRFRLASIVAVSVDLEVDE